MNQRGATSARKRFGHVLRLLGWSGLIALMGAECQSEEIPATQPVGQVASIDDILRDLRSDDEQVRSNALDALEEASENLTFEETARLLHAACEDYPRPDEESPDIPRHLVEATADSLYEEHIKLIPRLFPRYSRPAQEAALLALSYMEGRVPARSYMTILNKHVKLGQLETLGSDGFEKYPGQSTVLFPDILRFLEDPKVAMEVCELCLSYLECELLTGRDLERIAPRLVEMSAERREKLMPLQRDTGVAWRYEEAYLPVKGEAGLVLDVLGYLPGRIVEDELHKALAYRDPYLKLFAVVSLFRRDLEVKREHLEAVAANAERRNWLFSKLASLNKLSLFPERYRTQESFAESKMVNWLVYPTELGSEPDEIELMKTIEIPNQDDDDIDLFYLFRFRTHEPHWAAEKGWMVGVSGPFSRKQAPTTNGGWSTFSSFEPWDSKSADEHFQGMVGTIEAYEEHAATRESE